MTSPFPTLRAVLFAAVALCAHTRVMAAPLTASVHAPLPASMTAPEDARGNARTHPAPYASTHASAHATASVPATAPAAGPASLPASAPASAPATRLTLTAIPSLHVPSYMGNWYQVAWFPNRFQKQCVSDTSATYQRREDGNITVLNRCKTADGSFDDAEGLARPAGSRLVGESLRPAQLQVSFLPAYLRWLPIWGSYWVLELADDGRYAVIGEPTREYLWVLSRTTSLASDDETGIRSRLVQRGYDLSRWQTHRHAQPTAPR